MNTDQTCQIASQWETELRSDAAHIKQLDRDFGVTMRSARDLGIEQKFTQEWDTTWLQRWSVVDGHLISISGLVNTMDEAINSTLSDRLTMALQAWESIHLEGVHLVESMRDIRLQASALNPAARIEWNQLSTAFNANLENLNVCSQSLRVKLEQLMEDPHTETDLQVTLPLEEEKDVKINKSDLDAAAVELDREHHQAGGFWDVIKGLFLWVESPEERVKSDRSP
jgi:hypothetical protein